MLIVTGYRRDADGDYQDVTARRVRSDEAAAELALKWAEYYDTVGVRPDGYYSSVQSLREDEVI